MTGPHKHMLTLAACYLLAGCASLQGVRSDPARDPASVELPARFALAPDLAFQDRSALDSLLPANDPAFVQLRAAALQGAPTLAAAQARIEQARARADGANANRFPSIGYDASVTGARINPGSFGGGSLPSGIVIDRYRTTYGANIAASWDPDIFGGLRAAERAARIRIDAASADAAAIRLQLISAIAADIADWQTLDARESVLRADLEAADELAGLARTRVSAGLNPGLDLVQADSLAADTRARLQELTALRARITGSLVTLTATDTASVLARLSSSERGNALQLLPAATPSEMLRARPDIAAAEARLAAADADIAVAARQRFPKFSLSGAIGLLVFSLGDIFSADSLIGSIGGAVAGPLLDFGRIDAEIAQNRAVAREAFADYRGTVFTALGDVEAGYGAVQGAYGEMAALDARLALERDAEYLTGIRYRRGLTDFSNVLDARRRLNVVRTDAALARGRYMRARIALWLSLGGS